MVGALGRIVTDDYAFSESAIGTEVLEAANCFASMDELIPGGGIMNAIGERWEALFWRLDSEAQATRSAQDVVLQMADAYTALTPPERSVVAELLSGWVLTEDKKKRFIALALIRDKGLHLHCQRSRSFRVGWLYQRPLARPMTVKRLRG